MTASQMCPACGSPLDPCKCEYQARKRERRTRQWERAYGSEERVKWVQSLPSVVSGNGPCVNAHVPDPNGPSGMGRKSDARWIVPLTLAEERELHRVGIETFQRRHRVDLQAKAREIEARWRATS